MFDGIDDVLAIGHLPEDRVLAIEVWSGTVRDEKLGAVGAGTGIGHRQHTRRTVAELWMELIGELVARTAAARSSGVAALDHEISDYAVKLDVVVVTAAGEIEEIRAGEGSLGCVKRGFDVACVGVDGDFDVGHGGGANTDFHVLATPGVRPSWFQTRLWQLFGTPRRSDCRLRGRVGESTLILGSRLECH